MLWLATTTSATKTTKRATASAAAPPPPAGQDIEKEEEGLKRRPSEAAAAATSFVDLQSMPSADTTTDHVFALPVRVILVLSHTLVSVGRRMYRQNVEALHLVLHLTQLASSTVRCVFVSGAHLIYRVAEKVLLTAN